ncbi:MAG: hypothetical protein AAF333_11380 [Planctomycetota bacterium]
MRLRKRAAWGFVALAAWWGPSLTSAAFVDGAETFDGTTLDTATWQPYTEPVGAITQDDRLILSRDLSGRVDYVTRDVAVGIGQGVRVDFEILEGIDEGSVEAQLYLTNNSAGDTAATFFDSRNLAFFYSSGRRAFFGRELGSGSGSIGFGTEPAPFTLEILRLASDTVRFAAYREDGGLIGAQTRTLELDFPDELFVGVGIGNTAAVIAFDNVAIVPTPGTGGLLALAGLALWRRRGLSAG